MSPGAREIYANHPVLTSSNANSLWDSSEPRSLPNLLPGDIVELIQETKAKQPEWFTQDEKTLRETFNHAKLRPTPTVGILRLKFWHEYDRAQAKKSSMVMVNVYGGICFKEHMMHALRTPHNLAWILCPPADYIAALEEGIVEGLHKAREILGARTEINGKIDVKLAELQFKMLVYFDQRRHGAIVQKIENTTKSLNVNMNATSKEDMAAMIEHLSEEEIDKRIAELQKKPTIEVKAE